MHFTKLGLIEPLVRAVRSEGYLQPTPIQERAIPHVLAGKDLLGCAQTGTGKT
ncbi:MAG: DEAD/DEAH box helicase, partial [Phycisphaerae bacterium]|nr:DEAD/DEAH box helicase [Phycisphaerae bacterium]